MKIRGILSDRNFRPDRSWQLIFEWENIFSKKNNLKIYPTKQIILEIILKLQKLSLGNLIRFLDSKRPVKNYYLYYVMTASDKLHLSNFKNIIPIIVDFWLKEEELPKFFNAYKNCRLMLISSLEVYDFLLEKKCPINIKHFPLSIPDTYVGEVDLKSNRKYDFILAGRVNPDFKNFVEKYAQEYPNKEYLYQKTEDKIPYYYSNKTGKIKGDYLNRENFKKLLSNTTYAFYTTPGLDPSKENSNGYNQITPRFLELISAGCIVLGLYSENSDSKFYEIDEYCQKIKTYDDFKIQISKYKNSKILEKTKLKYSKYLCKHKTSQRSILLDNLINKIQ
jgi:hypothetical protein